MQDSTASDTPAIPYRIQQWLEHAIEAGASDLHLVACYPPVLRVHGDLVQSSEPELDREETDALLRELCSPDALSRLQHEKNADFSFSLTLRSRTYRFRANL